MPLTSSANNALKKNVLVAGSSGLVGTALLAALRAAGHHALPLVRRADAPGAISWDPLADRMDSAIFANIDAVINLAGENLAQGRWTAAKKLSMSASRLQSTSLLAKTLAQLEPRPRIFLCASAIGIYGNRSEEVLSEDSLPGQGFIADLCQQWEQACAPAVAAGVRVTNLRLGVVLSAAGGALAQMLTPFRLSLGGAIGSGRQYVSWIALEDTISAILHLLDHSQLAGPVNLVAPQAVTNLQLTKSLGQALHRPTLFPLPAFAARLALGEIADELLLASTRVMPKRLLDDGFIFQYPRSQSRAFASVATRSTLCPTAGRIMTSPSLTKEIPLYEALLGTAWDHLAPSLQRAHRVLEQLDSAGHFDILRGSGLLALLLLPFMGMPPTGKAVPTRLRMLRRDQREEWHRSFGDFPLNSIQHLHDVGLLAERFGRLEVRFKVEVCSGRICYRQCRGAVRVGGCWLPLPMWLGPRIDAEESPGQTPNQTRVCVVVRLPLVGLLLEYRGEMETQETSG